MNNEEREVTQAEQEEAQPGTKYGSPVRIDNLGRRIDNYRTQLEAGPVSWGKFVEVLLELGIFDEVEAQRILEKYVHKQRD